MNLFEATQAHYERMHYTITDEPNAPHYRALCPDDLRRKGHTIVCQDEPSSAAVLLGRFSNLKRLYPNNELVFATWTDKLKREHERLLDADITILTFAREQAAEHAHA